MSLKSDRVTWNFLQVGQKTGGHSLESEKEDVENTKKSLSNDDADGNKNDKNAKV